jgi:hypothetical protein
MRVAIRLASKMRTVAAARPMTDCRDHHATIFVASEAARLIEAARREWDPVVAAQLAAHITLAYPQEAPIIDLLI